MPELPLASAYSGRPRLDLPAVRQVNAYSEKADGGPTPQIRTPRPGLTPTYTLGVGPILRQYQKPGFFNGDLFTVSGSEVYRNSTKIADVAYGQFPRMAGANDQLAIVDGGALYVYDGGSFATISFFDDGSSPLPPLSGVSVLYNIFVFPITGTNQFLFSSVGNAKVINAANFSSAQVNPDDIVESAVLAEEIYFFKNTSTEIWDFTGALTAPFAESPGRTYARGCSSQGGVAQLDNALFWPGDDFTLYRNGAVPVRVSTPLIEDRLRAAGNDGVAQITSFKVEIEGHVFYVFNLPTLRESWAYDCQTSSWAQWGTQDPSFSEPKAFIGNTSAGQGSTIWIGSALDGRVWTLDPRNNTDDGIAKRVVISGAIWKSEGVERCNNVNLHCVRGVGTTEAPDPIVEMRWSDDGGRTFTSWRQSQLGKVGQYRYKAIWPNCGLIKQPGRLFEFSVSDPVNFTVEGAAYNVARP